jgi:hypothetical protein
MPAHMILTREKSRDAPSLTIWSDPGPLGTGNFDYRSGNDHSLMRFIDQHPRTADVLRILENSHN